MTHLDAPNSPSVQQQTTVQHVVANLVALLREDRDRYMDPKARALFEKAVLVGLDQALKDAPSRHS
ncbi:MAG: hypothetical protein U0105_18250 [Candidatus Obscuribacterales bacterium]|jgi:hypothetical protein